MPSLSDLIPKIKPVEEQQVSGMPSPFLISQSLIKTMINQGHEWLDHCPKQIWHLYFEKPKKFSEHKKVFDIGKLGETLLLGGSAKGDSVTELARSKKDGSMLTTEINVRRSVVFAEKVFSKHQISVVKLVNTQVPVICKVDGYDDVYLQTELDLFPTTFVPNPHKPERQGCIAAIDIKFPSKIKGFGAYSWDNVEHMDHIQPDSIFYILERYNKDLCKQFNPEWDKTIGYDNVITPYIQQFMKNDIKFFYMVIPYAECGSIEHIKFYERLKCEIGKSPTFRQKEFHQRMVMAIERLKDYFNKSFYAVPFHDSYRFKGCKYCPVNSVNGGNCNEAITIQSV